MSFEIKHYIYIDDADRVWTIKVSDYLAQAGGLEEKRSDQVINPLGGRTYPRHMKLVQVDDRPGRQKYRCDVITNEKDPTKVLNKIFEINGFRVRCTRFIGEQWRA
jgi:hypothetical protein